MTRRVIPAKAGTHSFAALCGIRGFGRVFVRNEFDVNAGPGRGMFVFRVFFGLQKRAFATNNFRDFFGVAVKRRGLLGLVNSVAVGGLAGIVFGSGQGDGGQIVVDG